MEEIQPNSAGALCAEILAAARRESDSIRRQAETEAASLLAAANSEAERIRREAIEQAQAKARRRKELIMATVTVEARRMHSSRVEELLESVHDELRRRLHAKNSDGSETVIALAAEAIGQMPEDHFILKISAADNAAFGNNLAGEIIRKTGRSSLDLSISADTPTDGGVVIQTANGSQMWDNRLSSRLERFWPELRRQIAVSAGLVSENNSTAHAP